MDETGVVFPTSPTDRKRPRVVIGGDTPESLVPVINADPAADAYGAVVRNIVGKEHPGTALWECGTVTLVPVGPESTVATYTVPANKTLYVASFYVSGDVNARFCFYYGSSQIIIVRTSVAKLSESVLFSVVRPAIPSGSTVTIKVLHGATGIQANFEATILGYLVDS
jgi:hypothetical protein